jgi:UDP-N-acetylglucosamine enolpyruvyl transferase
MSYNLRKMGADIRVISATNPATKHGGFANSYGERGGSAKNFGGKTAESEKIIIRGLGELKGARVRSFGDHRTAMSMVVAGLKARGKTRIDDVTCINKSFPDFLSILKTLIQ